MSKGHRQRPFNAKKFGDNYDKIFGKKRAENLVKELNTKQIQKDVYEEIMKDAKQPELQTELQTGS